MTVFSAPPAFGPGPVAPRLEAAVGPAAFEEYVRSVLPMFVMFVITPLPEVQPSPATSIEVNVGGGVAFCAISAPTVLPQHASDDFVFRGIGVARPKPLSAGSAAFLFSCRSVFKLPAPGPAIGGELFGLSGLLGGGVGVRRVRPTPEQLELQRGI